MATVLQGVYIYICPGEIDKKKKTNLYLTPTQEEGTKKKLVVKINLFGRKKQQA